MGLGEHDNRVYLIDFGLAKRYRDAGTHLHISCRDNYPLTGTAAFASINNHLGIEQSRRDDLESLAYVFIYLLCGSLPWHVPDNASRKPTLKAMLKKKMASPDVLCHSCPNEFGIFLNYARTLQFDGKPDYTYLRHLFHNVLVREGYQSGDAFEWCIPKDGIANISAKTSDCGHKLGGHENTSHRVSVPFSSLCPLADENLLRLRSQVHRHSSITSALVPAPIGQW